MTRITNTATMNVPSTLTAAALMDFCSSIPAEARISVKEHPGDQRDPGYVTLTATWDGAASRPATLPHSHIPGARR